MKTMLGGTEAPIARFLTKSYNDEENANFKYHLFSLDKENQMARITSNIKTLSSPKKLKKLGNKMQSKTYNGVRLNPGNSSDRKTLRVLSFSRACQAIGAKQPSPPNEGSIKKISNDILEIGGISISRNKTMQNKSYSLTATQTDTAIVMNPNILNAAQYQYIEKKQITLTSMVKSPNDAFYSLDAPIGRAKTAQLEEAAEAAALDLTNLASSLISLTKNSSTHTIRQFKMGGT